MYYHKENIFFTVFFEEPGSQVVHDTTEVLSQEGEWSYGPTMPISLFAHCITPVEIGGNETFMLHGGRTDFWAISGKVWLFDWDSQTWSPLPDLITPVAGHACAPFTKGDGTKMIITAGGNSRVITPKY